MKKKPFKQAFFDFLNSGSVGRQFLIYLIIMFAVIGAFYAAADTAGAFDEPCEEVEQEKVVRL